MIYTITFSPSIDYVINTNNEFDPNGLNRVSDYDFVVGGKGINASIILKRIGFENEAITFLGKNTKHLFKELIKNENVSLFNIDVNEDTRINVKYFSKNNNFEINGKRPNIDEKQFQLLINKINTFNENDIVFIMGYCDDKLVIEILKILKEKNIKFILDIDSKEMLSFIKYKPFLIKPNFDELQRLLNVKIDNDNQLLNSMKQLKEMGCQNLMVSNGSKGSYLLTENNEFYKVKVDPISDIVSTVGAGDTLISSFAMLYITSKNVTNSLISATSLSIGTIKTKFLANKEDMQKYTNKIFCEKI